MASVRNWLAQNELGEFADAFERERISVDMLEKLTDAELDQLGLATIGDRRRFRDALARSKMASVSGVGGAASVPTDTPETPWWPSLDVFLPLWWAVPASVFVGALDWNDPQSGLMTTMLGWGIILALGAFHLSVLRGRVAPQDPSGVHGYVTVEVGLAVLSVGMALGNALALGWRMDHFGQAIAASIPLVISAAVPIAIIALTLASLRRKVPVGVLFFGAMALGSALAALIMLGAAEAFEQALAPMRRYLGRELDLYASEMVVSGLAMFGSFLMMGVRGVQASLTPLHERQLLVRRTIAWSVRARIVVAVASVLFFLQALAKDDDAIVGFGLVVGMVSMAVGLWNALGHVPDEVGSSVERTPDVPVRVQEPAGPNLRARLTAWVAERTSDEWIASARSAELVVLVGGSALYWLTTSIVQPTFGVGALRQVDGLVAGVMSLVLGAVVARHLRDVRVGVLVAGIAYALPDVSVELFSWFFAALDERWAAMVIVAVAAVFVARGRDEQGKVLMRASLGVQGAYVCAVAAQRLSVGAFGVWRDWFSVTDVLLAVLLFVAPHVVAARSLGVTAGRSHVGGVVLGLVAALAGWWDLGWLVPVHLFGGLWMVGHHLGGWTWWRRGLVWVSVVHTLLFPILPWGMRNNVECRFMTPVGQALTNVEVEVGGDALEGTFCDVPAGLRRWTFRHPLLEGDVVQWHLPRSFQVLEVTLPVTKGYVRVTGSDPLAPLTIDGKPLSAFVTARVNKNGEIQSSGAEERLVLSAGPHTLGSENAGWVFTERTFDVKAGATTEETLKVERRIDADALLEELRAALGTVELTEPVRQTGTTISLAGMAASTSLVDAADGALEAAPHFAQVLTSTGAVTRYGERVPFTMRADVVTPTPISIDGRGVGAVRGPAVPVLSVTASSELAPVFMGGIAYAFGAAQLVDGKLDTSWQPARDGQTQVLHLTYAPTRVQTLRIANGFQRTDLNGDMFVRNRRVARVSVRTSNGHERAFDVPDLRGWTELDLGDPQTSDGLAIEVERVHANAEWEDVAMSELALFGPVPSVTAGAAAP